MDTQIALDAKLIEQLGGPAKVADLLGFDKASGGVQRVHNWTTRGIPSKVKVKYPHIFMAGVLETTEQAA